MQNDSADSRPKFDVISNGALVFSVPKPNILTGKWIKLFFETVLAFNLHFQHIGLNLRENQVYHSKERKILVRKYH